jgi:branched-subunit amino acid aminotransferase/4-amino-4-deoxychorismate lyase
VDPGGRRLLALHSPHGHQHPRTFSISSDRIKRGRGLTIRDVPLRLQPSVGVGASSKAKIFIICSPVGPYYPEGFNPVKLYANDQYIRAWPGGTGGFKLGAYVSIRIPNPTTISNIHI